MESKNLMICDPQEKYAQALALYLIQRKEFALQVTVCSSMAHAAESEKRAGTDILLISDSYTPEERQQRKAEHIFVLTELMEPELAEGEICLYRYQSGEKMLEVLLRECESLYLSEKRYGNPERKNRGKIIGVYSPVHRIGKTTYALRLGEELAEGENVLYLSLEVYGGIGGHFDEEGQTLADVLYYARQEKGNLGLFLTSMVHHRGNLDYVLPMPVSTDMKEVRAAEWAALVEKILEESIYETVILDLDEGVPDVYELLEMCEQIYMPVLKDACAAAKIRQFEREVALMGKESVLKKITRKEVRS